MWQIRLVCSATILALSAAAHGANDNTAIDRHALVSRHDVVVHGFAPDGAMAVGNGEFAFNFDATGMQTFPEFYQKTMPIGILSTWGWHRFPNINNYSLDDFPMKVIPKHDRTFIFPSASTSSPTPEAAYLRTNPQRFGLARIGLELLKADGTSATIADLSQITQHLDLWTGSVTSSFIFQSAQVQVFTAVHPDRDEVAIRVESPLIAAGRLKVRLAFPYASDSFGPDYQDWTKPDAHQTIMTPRGKTSADFARTLDAMRYNVRTTWNDGAAITETAKHQYLLSGSGSALELSRDSLQSNSELFLQLARERLCPSARGCRAGAQGTRNRDRVHGKRPIREALAKTEAQIQFIERDRIDSFATIKAQMEILASGQSSLSRETRNLVTALRRPDVRGQWGEMTLRRLVELSGMTAHVDFTEQLHVATASGAVRPDMVVHMPEQREIVVDVKTPLEAYLAAAEAQDDEQRDAQLRRHASIVAARIRELASKQYWAQFERSPDFVVLFLPGEQFLSAALQVTPGLLDESMRQNVMLATPTSLVALLKAVSYGWKQSLLAQSAAEIRLLGEEIYKRLAVFGEHLGKLGRSLSSSVDSFNKAVGSLEQQVLPAARKFPELGLRVTREIAVMEPIENLARVPCGVASEASEDGVPERT